MSDLMIIFGFILLIAIIAFGMGGMIHSRDLRFKQRKLELESEVASRTPAADARKIEQLEQRVRVLERLATDRGQDLALQIENLRDPAQKDLSPDFAPPREESRA